MGHNELAKLIITLRDKTGEGMMDCKRALEKNGYDIDKAEKWLNETRCRRRRLT